MVDRARAAAFKMRVGGSIMSGFPGSKQGRQPIRGGARVVRLACSGTTSTEETPSLAFSDRNGLRQISILLALGCWPALAKQRKSHWWSWRSQRDNVFAPESLPPRPVLHLRLRLPAKHLGVDQHERLVGPGPIESLEIVAAKYLNDLFQHIGRLHIHRV